MLKKISILGEESIFIGNGIQMMNEVKKEISSLYASYSFIVIVTDQNVAQAGHLNNLEKLLHENDGNNNQKFFSLVISPGEVNKNRDVKAFIEDSMLSNKCTRDTLLIALGGGVIGDLVGYVAACFMRGIPVIQIPTTLLAMVDSSIGGKTAIDTPLGKNLIGAFHQPARIFINLDYLSTLPHREFVNGMAEVIKTAAIWNSDDFELLESFSEKILNIFRKGKAGDSESHDLLFKIVHGSVSVKAHVVTLDEKEGGLRGLLNFGHTIGHAIEAIVYPDLLHGECVAIGMTIEAEISRHLGHLKDLSVERLARCLASYGLPTSLRCSLYAEKTGRYCSVDKMMDIMKLDKKNVGSQKKIVLLTGLGQTLEPRASAVEEHVIIRVLSPGVGICKVNPSENITINVPGSKSISNRALLMAALGKGPCRLTGLLHSDDVKVMLDALQALMEIKFSWEDDGDTLLIIGGEGKLRVPSSQIYLNNAGTAARFLTTVCSLIEGLPDGDKNVVLTGNERMKKRPIKPLVDTLLQNGVKIRYIGEQSFFPLEIEPCGLAGGLMTMSASLSSQYVSSVLISAPYAKSPVILDLSGDSVISERYIEMTISMMKSFGIEVKRVGSTKRYVVPLGVYTNPAEYKIEADASSATYPLAFAAITNSTVTVTNMGYESLQGDAEFATKILRPMGCIVNQTANTTTVTGPKELLPFSIVDMESLTDAFMTAAVLAAVAQNPKDPENSITRIVGIANQRIKECDRIAVMNEQLGRLGVTTSELSDGICIQGIDRLKLNVLSDSGIECYDDHRIAMSFSILACAATSSIPRVISDKRCVEKTWPGWWDTMQNLLKVDTIGVDGGEAFKQTAFVKPFVPGLSIFLIGMRGVGKTTLGSNAATQLKMKFIDLDEYFEKDQGMSISQYIEVNDWESFRKIEGEILEKCTKEFPKDYIIACGGGVVESGKNRQILSSWPGLVVHVKRDIKIIEHYLKSDLTRPALREDINVVWSRRKPLYTECSNCAFYIVPAAATSTESYIEKIAASFIRFLEYQSGTEPIPLPQSDPSFFVSLTCTVASDLWPIMDQISLGASALELRADLLQGQMREDFARAVFEIRLMSQLPIIFTLRTVSQGGKFPDDNVQRRVEMLKAALRWGCEYIDIEFGPHLRHFDEVIANKRHSRIIASYHDINGVQSWGKHGTMTGKYYELYKYGDIIKLVGNATSFDDNFLTWKFVSKIVPSFDLTPKPTIALLMGAPGMLSRSLNNFMTPVTHKLLPFSAAPGQVTIADIHRVRSGIGLLDHNKYCLLGSPISQSMSPLLHNTGFEILGLPYSYHLEETTFADKVKTIMEHYDGASVTIPLKVDIVNLQICYKQCEPSKKIGAINTLVKDKKGLQGYNTDWIGISKSIIKYVPESKPVVGLVIGAGGTCRAAIYALSQLENIKEIRIWNRTFSNTKKLCKEFPGIKAVAELSDLMATDCAPGFVYVLVSTIPASAQSTLNFTQMFETSSPRPYSCGVIVEMAYRSLDTELLLAKRTFKFPSRRKWHAVTGIEVLLEQGYEQFKIWTGFSPPREQIYSKVIDSHLN